MTRYTSTGNARAHIVAPGYRYESAQHARLEREADPINYRMIIAGPLLALVWILIFGGVL